MDFYWRHIDPLDPSGQFADQGPQYRTAIFYHDQEQKNLAEESKKQLEQSKRFSKPIATKILPAKEFYKAEGYHQDYYQKQNEAFERYKKGSGREERLKELWD